jgi:hypothetical protein
MNETLKEMKAKIAWQYKDCAFINAYTEFLAEELEELKQVARSVDDATSLSQARGVQQDKNGEILNRQRPVVNNKPVSDDMYKKMLYAKAGQNISKALAYDIKRVFMLLTDAREVFLDDYWRQVIVLSYRGNPLPPEQKPVILNAINSTTRLGIETIKILRLNDDALMFGGTFGGTFSEREI